MFKQGLEVLVHHHRLNKRHDKRQHVYKRRPSNKTQHSACQGDKLPEDGKAENSAYEPKHNQAGKVDKRKNNNEADDMQGSLNDGTFDRIVDADLLAG